MITPSLDGGGFGVHGGFADFRLISLAALFLAIDGVHGKPCIPRIASAFAYPQLVRVRVPVRVCACMCAWFDWCLLLLGSCAPGLEINLSE